MRNSRIWGFLTRERLIVEDFDILVRKKWYWCINIQNWGFSNHTGEGFAWKLSKLKIFASSNPWEFWVAGCELSKSTMKVYEDSSICLPNVRNLKKSYSGPTNLRLTFDRLQFFWYYIWDQLEGIHFVIKSFLSRKSWKTFHLAYFHCIPCGYYMHHPLLLIIYTHMHFSHSWCTQIVIDLKIREVQCTRCKHLWVVWLFSPYQMGYVLQ